MTLGVFGAARDGSTLLMRLLDGSPDLWIYPIEIKFFNQIAPQRQLRAWRRDATGVEHAPVPIETLRRYVTHQLDELEKGYLVKLVGERPERAEVELPPLDAHVSWGEALEWFLDTARRSLAGGEGRRLGFKTTEALEKRLYERALGSALHAVHIVRNPLEQFASTKRTVLERPEFLYWFQGANARRVLPVFVQRWCVHAESALEAVDRDPQRALLVRYEDIRSDPEAQVAAICDWLDARPPARPDIQTVLDGRRMTALPANPSKAAAATPEHVVADTAAEFGYEDVVQESERRAIAVRTGRLARALGYDVPRATQVSRLRAVLRI